MIQALQDRKVEVNRIWANTVDDGQTPYNEFLSYAPESVDIGNGTFASSGTLTVDSNGELSPVASNDSQVSINKVFPNNRLEGKHIDGRWYITIFYQG